MKQQMVFEDFIELVYSTRDKALLRDLLYSVTTPHERHEIPRRIEVVQRLLRGDSQEQISQDIGAGIATITRGSKELGQGHFKLFRDRK